MGSFNACPMAISLLESIRALSPTCSKQCLHLLLWMQRHAASSCSGTQGPRGTDLAITAGKLHFDQGFVGLLNGCPARTGAPLRTGNGLRFPIDGEVREVVAGLRLIPVGFERGTKQVHPGWLTNLRQLKKQ